MRCYLAATVMQPHPITPTPFCWYCNSICRISRDKSTSVGPCLIKTHTSAKVTITLSTLLRVAILVPSLRGSLSRARGVDYIRYAHSAHSELLSSNTAPLPYIHCAYIMPSPEYSCPLLLCPGPDANQVLSIPVPYSDNEARYGIDFISSVTQWLSASLHPGIIHH